MSENLPNLQTSEKQTYLRLEIIEQNYDPNEFTEWMESQKEDGESIKSEIFRL